MLSDTANKYMQKKEPWIKAKQVDGSGEINPEAQALIDNCLHVCLQLSANLAILINPFMPNTAKKMCYMMKVVDRMLEWENAGKTNLLSVGYSLRAPELLMRKIEDAEVQYQADKLKTALQKAQSEIDKLKIEQENSAGSQPSAVSHEQTNETAGQSAIVSLKSEIVYEDFDKLDLRIGTILTAEKVQKADKLLKLEVDLGFEKRTIVSGIAQHFTPEDLVNKQVIVVANLAPRKMRGIESQGMILTAEEPTGKLILVNPDAFAQNGSNVK
jgi:methionyl-tRNA synthetase